MKKITGFIFITIIGLLPLGCKKFLDVKPMDKLSGNMFWKSPSDVNAFTMDLYAKFRNKLTSTEFMPAVGDLRSGYILPATINNSNSAAEKAIREVYSKFATNDLRSVLSTTREWKNLNYSSITKWVDFYQVIQGANILCDQVDKGVPDLTDALTKQFHAEGVFLRCLAYFFMVRIYGDVVYYTKAYDQDVHPRENFVDVLNSCIKELNDYKKYLPLAYSDPAYTAVRATRGAANALLMNMNMWNAGFDKANKSRYFQAAADEGKEIIESNTYKLVSLDEFAQVMKGRSQEGIFEFNQSTNYEGLPNFRAFFGEIMLKYPEKGAGGDNNSSHAYFKAKFLARLYPEGQADRRKDLWFDANMLSETGNFEFLKFKGDIISGATGAGSIPEWDLIIFRYAGILLLRAEALEELGNNDVEAIKMLNLVRQRAGTADYSGAGAYQLSDAIFNERCKELMGEGQLYFDLVRTGRIMNMEWTDDPLTQSQFDQGAWTWPIDPSALLENPSMKLNIYWQ